MTSTGGRGLFLLGGLALLVWIVFSIATRGPAPVPDPGRPELVGDSGTRHPELRGSAEWVPAELLSPTSTEAEVPETGVVVMGRILDGNTYRPWPDVVVSATYPGRARVEGRVTAEGAFRLPLGPRPAVAVELALRATTADGRGVTTPLLLLPVGPDVEDVGTLLLRRTTTLLVRTLHQGRAVVGTRVFAASVPLPRRPHRDTLFERGWPPFTHEASTDAEGVARLEDLPIGAVRLLAQASGPLRGERQLAVDDGTGRVEMVLRGARDLRVEVVEMETGDPIPGCALVPMVEEQRLERPGARPLTDVRGLAVLVALPDDVSVRVAVIGPTWSTNSLRGVLGAVAEPGVDALRIQIPSLRWIRFPVVAEDGPFPDDGTRVALDQPNWAFRAGEHIDPGREGRIQDGDLVVAYRRTSRDLAVARLPDGRVGFLVFEIAYDSEEARFVPRLPPEPVVFRQPRTLRVEVTERGSDRPAAGVAVAVRLKRARKGTLRLPTLDTDERGVAVVTGLPPMSGWCSVCANPTAIRRSRRGVFSPGAAIDLEAGDVDLRFEVEGMVEGILDVTTQGRPGFPPGFRVEMWLLPEGVTWRPLPDVEYNADASQVRFRLRPPLIAATPPVRIFHGERALLLRVTSDTCATEHLRLEAGRPLRAAVDLVEAGALITRVSRPRDVALFLRLEVQDANDAWEAAWATAAVPFSDAEAGDLHDGLRPGRYRLRMERLGWTSSEVTVRPGPQPTRLDWDLSGAGYAEGEVVLPAGVDLQGLVVLVLEEDPPHRVVSSATLDGTTFRALVPGDRPVVLKPVHSACESEAETGSVTLSRPKTGLRLRMKLRAR